MLLVTELLSELGIPYVIGGSVASTIYGMPRMTMDVDIVADFSLEKVEPFIAGLGHAFYIDADSIKTAVMRQASFNLIHYETAFKVDVFVVKKRPFDQQQLARRQPKFVDEAQTVQVWVLSPEDVILAKLDWFQLGGGVSERQWRDILGVIKTQENTLDIDYLQKWAAELDVLELLNFALVDDG